MLRWQPRLMEAKASDAHVPLPVGRDCGILLTVLVFASITTSACPGCAGNRGINSTHIWKKIRIQHAKTIVKLYANDRRTITRQNERGLLLKPMSPAKVTGEATLPKSSSVVQECTELEMMNQRCRHKSNLAYSTATKVGQSTAAQEAQLGPLRMTLIKLDCYPPGVFVKKSFGNTSVNIQ